MMNKKHVIGQRSYSLATHKNDIVSVISDLPIPHQGASGTVDYYLASILQATDYSGFGVKLHGRNFTKTGAVNIKFGFQGQLEDGELKGDGNSVNYKYRMHDPRLGRFFAVDPLSAKYPHNSPYAFSENRVIDGVELEGLEYFRITHNNGIIHLALIDLSSDFKVEYINEEGQKAIHKNFVFSNFQQRMKGPNGEPFNPESQVDLVNKNLYAPKSGLEKEGGKEFGGEDPDFHIMTVDNSLVKKVPVGGPGFIATDFTTTEEAFSYSPMEEQIFNSDGTLFRDVILPANYDYLDVYTVGHTEADILDQLEIHGVDVKNKEINFIKTAPVDVDPASPNVISIEFGTYE